MESKEVVIEYAEQLLAFEYQKKSAVVELSRPQAINILQLAVDAKSLGEKKDLLIAGGEKGLDASFQFENIGEKMQEAIMVADQAKLKKVSVLFNLSEIDSLKGIGPNRSAELKAVKKRVGTDVRGLIKKFEKALDEQDKQVEGERLLDNENS